MRQSIIALTVIIFIINVTSACAARPVTVSNASPDLFSEAKSDNNSVSTNTVENKVKDVTTVHVDDLALDPEQFTGQIIVQGVVSSVEGSQHLIGMIDSREYEECKVTTCSSFILPVQWAGKMPEVEDTIQVTGKIEKSGGKYYFIASLLEIISGQTGSAK